MSFSYNPYKHIELIQRDHDDGRWFWHCHSCGADSDREDRPYFLISFDLGELVASFRSHIRNSHNRTEQDFEGWGKY